MVKGTSKRVVVVKNPDSRIFEQAIFIVREDFLSRRRDGACDILREAQDVADQYIQSTVMQPSRKPRFPNLPVPLLFLLLVGASAGGVWATLHFVFGIF